MANVRDSDTSLWLHNKLGTSNDSWISGSICSQLSKEVLRNVKECFPDLQTQVKLKFLLTFFHIPRRLIDEWKSELEEIIEVACLDSELWVAMLAETMKTFPSSSSLNTEISEYEDTRPIFTDMVNDLRKLVNKHCDLGMLPLECQYLNKNALISVVGQQPNPVKHFTLKRKPKSANLRTELLHKSADAQSSLKKSSAPTIPLRSRGMPRKMTDTTPLKGIPSRVPTSGFRTPNLTNNQQRPNLSRTPAGRKDGGIKLIEFTDQPLGYAAAKKRKREQQLEEQQKKQEQKLNAAAAAAAAAETSSPTESNAQGTTNSNAGTPTTPTSANASFEIKKEGSPLFQGNQSEGGTDLQTDETKNGLVPKSESVTPDYAPPTLTYSQPSVSTMSEPGTLEEKKVSKVPKVSSTSVQTQNNSVGRKRIKQEIEIKEEIIVPASIKVEKIEPKSQTHQQQRIIIQQQQSTVQQGQGQPQTQHVLIRAAPQPKQTLGGLTLSNNSSSAQLTTSSSSANTLPGTTTIKMEKLDIKTLARTTGNASVSSNSPSALLTQQQIRQSVNPLANLPNNISVKITSTKAKSQQQQQQQAQSQQQQPILINSSTPVIISSSPTQQQGGRQKQLVASGSSGASTSQSLKSMPLSQLKSAANSGPVIISQTIIQPAKRPANSSLQQQQQPQQQQQQQQQLQSQPQQQQQQQQQYILTTPAAQQTSNVPALTSFAPARPAQQTTLYTTGSTTTSGLPGSTKILLKTTPNAGVVIRQQAGSNPPPLIASSTPLQQPTTTMLNIQNVQLPNRPVTIQPASQAAQQQHLQAQLQQQQQPKLSQMIVQQPNSAATSIPNVNVNMNVNANAANAKNKTIYLTQKGVFLRNIGGDVYQQIPISNVGGLQGLSGGTTTLLTTAAGPPSLVKTTPSASSNLQTQTIQIQQSPTKQALPTLISTNAIAPQHMIVQQQPTQTNLITNTTPQTIIRPVMQNVQGGLTTLSTQGLTFLQRPGQQPQLVQVQTTAAGQQQQQQQQQQRTIITQPAQATTQQLRPQQIVLQHKPVQQQQQQRLISTPASQTQQIQIQQSPTLAPGTRIVQVTQQSQPAQQQSTAAPQRKGLSLSNEHVHKAHEMFRKANRVSRPDKALILGFMAGLRENPRPNSENVIVIKLGETEEKVQQDDGSTPLCLVESHIRLDYNTGEWKTFQNYRRLDQNAGEQAGDAGNATMMQTQNSVVI